MVISEWLIVVILNLKCASCIIYVNMRKNVNIVVRKMNSLKVNEGC